MTTLPVTPAPLMVQEKSIFLLHSNMYGWVIILFGNYIPIAFDDRNNNAFNLEGFQIEYVIGYKALHS